MIIIPWEDAEFLEAWSEWKAYKKEEHRFSYRSARSQQAALKKLVVLSDGDIQTAIDIINESIANGWKGFFKLKNDEQKSKNFAKGYADILIKKFGHNPSSGDGKPNQLNE